MCALAISEVLLGPLSHPLQTIERVVSRKETDSTRLRHNSSSVRTLESPALKMQASVLPVYICVSCECLCLQQSEGGIGSPGSGVRGGCEPPWGCWELNLGPREKYQVLLPLRHPSSPQSSIFSCQILAYCPELDDLRVYKTSILCVNLSPVFSCGEW